MKKTKLISVLCGIFLCASFLSPGQTEDYSLKPRQFERSRTFDALHYLVEIQLDIENKSFMGRSTIILSSLQDELDQIELDAEDFLVQKVTDNWDHPLFFEQTDTKLKIELKRKYNYGETLSLTATYRSEPEVHQSGEPKKGLRFYEATEDHPALVASDSWPNGVHHWFPCFDFPNDKATNEIIATVNEPNKVCANGRLVQVKTNKEQGTATYHWLQDNPHSTYLMFMAAAPYQVLKDHYKDIPINYWVFPQHVSDAPRSYELTPKMMEFFIKTFQTPYPWEKYDQVSVPFGGGAESTSATAMTYRILHDEKAHEDFSSIGIVSHELAHQWWGDLITLRSWEHAWMNESFGTYSDYLYTAHELGDREGQINLLNKKNSYLREAKNEYIRPIVTDRYDRPQDLFDAHSYPKGACVLHMLRFMLRDEAFFRIFKQFLHTYAFQPVDTHDFTKTVKQVTGKNMDWFFEQWLYKPGHPVLDISSVWDEKENNLTLKIRQTQDTSLGIPIYKTPVLIKLRTEQEESIQQIWLVQEEETFHFSLDSRPLLVRFDEGNYLLKEWEFSKSKEELTYQAKNDDVIGRMWACQELGNFQNDTKARYILQETAQEDSFWAVRQAAVETLGSWKEPGLISFLRAMCLDANSRVRASSLSALGEFGQKNLADFFKQRFQKEDSYLAQAQALRALGKTGDKEHIPFLKKAAAMPSYRNIIKNAAEEALDFLQQ
ncbi:MAG: aminopeptidase [Candidatus Aminicenantes bacterium]|nr:aminopeptidase [Candidatus Aminicenantes bacterium]